MHDSIFDKLDDKSKVGYLYLVGNCNGLGLVPKKEGLTAPCDLMKVKEGNGWYWLPEKLKKPQNPNIFKNWLGSLVELIEPEPVLVRLVLNHLTRIIPTWPQSFALPFTRAKRFSLRRLRATRNGTPTEPNDEINNKPKLTTQVGNDFHTPNAEIYEIFNANFVGNDSVYSLEEIEGYFAGFEPDSSEICGFGDFNQLENDAPTLLDPFDNIGVSGNHYHTPNAEKPEENGVLYSNDITGLQENTILEPNKDNELAQVRNDYHTPNAVILLKNDANFVAQDSDSKVMEEAKKPAPLLSPPLSPLAPSPSFPPVLPPYQPLPHTPLESPSVFPTPNPILSCPKHTLQQSLDGLEIPEPTGKRKGLGIPKNFDPLKIELPFSSEGFFTAWQNFVEHRNEIKKPLTPAACQSIFRKLKKHPEVVAIESLFISAERRWTGVFPESVPEVVNKRTLPPEIERALEGQPRHVREKMIYTLVQLGAIDPFADPVDAVG